MLKAGIAKTRITPPLGSRMAGFAARKGVALAVHDDLYARALALDNGRVGVVLLSLEVIAVSFDFVDRLRAAIHKQIGLPAQNILCAATHTHCGAVTIRAFFNSDEQIDQGYYDYLLDNAIRVGVQAWRQRAPVCLGHGSASVSDCGVNRCSDDGKPVDNELNMLKVENGQGVIRAVLLNYGCHPTVLGPNTLELTGDFPAVVLDEIERTCGNDAVAMFINGAQGNVGPGHSAAGSAIGIIDPSRTFDRAEAFGKRISQGALQELPEIRVMPEAPLAVQTARVKLPWKDYRPSGQLENELRSLTSELDHILQEGRSADQDVDDRQLSLLYKSIELYYARQSEHLDALEIDLQAVRIGDCAILAVPCELFTEIGMEIKKGSPLRTFIAGLANGYLGYLPTRQAYATGGGYECVSTGVAPEAADIIVHEGLDLLRSL